jgi:hypothetical protein
MKSFPALLFSQLSKLSAQSLSVPLAFTGNKIDLNSATAPVSSETMETPEEMVRQKGKLSLHVAQV